MVSVSAEPFDTEGGESGQALVADCKRPMIILRSGSAMLRVYHAVSPSPDPIIGKIGNSMIDVRSERIVNCEHDQASPIGLPFSITD